MHLDFYQHTVVYIALTVQLSWCQDWIWLGGDKIIDRLSSGGYPGGRSRSNVWRNNGTVWIFGGSGYTDVGTGKSHLLNDVWSFNAQTTQFRLQNPGTGTLNSDPLLPPLESDPLLPPLESDPLLPPPESNPTPPRPVVPSERQHAAMCGYQGKLHVFGGFGERGVSLGDLWTFDTSSRKWLEQNLSNCSSSGPSARGDAAVWCFKSSMYLFGGLSDNKTIFADMWKLDLVSVVWTQLIASEANNLNSLSYPAGRNGAVVWNSADILYMFGGNINSSFSLQFAAGLTSELWRYYLEDSSWQFVTGLAHPRQEGNTILPGGRTGSAAWTDSDGGLWLFGGAGLDSNPDSPHYLRKLLSDVWRFDVSVQHWDFIGCGDSGETFRKYGHLGEMGKNNFPGARTEMMAWEGGDNQVYIFGGVGYDEMHFDGHLNDLWRADLTAVISREYLVSPLLLLSYFGVASLLLVGALVLALCSRQTRHRRGGRLQFKLSPEYYRLDSDVT